MLKSCTRCQKHGSYKLVLAFEINFIIFIFSIKLDSNVRGLQCVKFCFSVFVRNVSVLGTFSIPYEVLNRILWFKL